MLNSPLSIARKTKDSDSNMIPMINVVFLLLVFFMMAGTIRKTHSQDVELPTSKSGKTLTPKQIDVSLTNNLILRINGEDVAINNFESRIEQLLDSENEPQVSFRVDKRVKAKDLDKILTTLRKQGVELITLYSLSEGSK